jgi:hypothetical protein
VIIVGVERVAIRVCNYTACKVGLSVTSPPRITCEDAPGCKPFLYFCPLSFAMVRRRRDLL